MNNSKIESLNKELEKIEVMSDIVGIAIVNRNGLLTTSILPIDVDERKFGAMAATMFGAIETIAINLESGTVNNITVEFTNYQIIVMGIDDQSVLVSLLDINTNLGIFFIEIEETIKNIKKILSR